MNDEDETFLKRWSRRKIEAKEQAADATPEAADAGAPAERKEGADAPAHAEAAPEKRALTEADFADVDFEALDMQSDYKRFLEPGVPDSIKYKALQKLWSSDPIFTAIEQFYEYAGDFTDKAVAVPAGTLQTAYRIGRGFMSDEEVAAWDKLGKPAEDKTAAGAAHETAAAASDPLMVRPEPADQPDVHALLHQSDAYFADLYPPEHNHLIDLAVLSQPNVRFVVARRDGIAVGCGALLLGDDAEAEIKRMFVAAEARGSGIGKQILAALEATGSAEGVRVIRLETGARQAEALALYKGQGYAERGPFGAYEAGTFSRFFEKWIG